MKKSLCLLLFSSLLFAEQNKFEYGVGIATLGYPVYIGSKTVQSVVAPYPYIYYVNGNFSVDRKGVKQKLFDADGFSINMNGSGMLPLRSKGLRTGMKRYDLAIEVGPSLEYEMYDCDGWTVKLEIPASAVLATDFTGIEYQGVVCDPKLSSKYCKNGYMVELETGPVFANAKYHDYYYGVNSSEVTATRPIYNGTSGYGGLKTSVALTRRIGHYWVGSFIKYYSLNGASFTDSPVVETNHAFYSGIAMAYIF